MDKSFLKVAVEAAKKAGKVLINGFGKLNTKKINKKGPSDYVTEFDFLAEDVISKTIKKYFPEHSILGEEQGLHNKNNKYGWLIDPLDGTTNYVHGFPMFSSSIALAENGKVILGVIFDPVRNELFHACKGRGAWLNNKPIQVSKQLSLCDALIATGFPFRHKDVLDVYLKSFREVFLHCGGIRRPGSASLDLAYTACGRVDGFWEYGLSSWDIAAGSIILKEAKGKITDFKGRENYLKSGNVTAGNHAIHGSLLTLIKNIF